MSPLGCAYFAFANVAYRHQCLYVYVPQAEGGGGLWFGVVRRTLWGMVCGNATLAGCMFCKESYYAGVVALPAIALPLLVGTFLEKVYEKGTHATPARERASRRAARALRCRETAFPPARVRALSAMPPLPPPAPPPAPRRAAFLRPQVYRERTRSARARDRHDAAVVTRPLPAAPPPAAAARAPRRRRARPSLARAAAFSDAPVPAAAPGFGRPAPRGAGDDGHRLADDDAPAHPSSRFRHHEHRARRARRRAPPAAARRRVGTVHGRLLPPAVAAREDARPQLRFSDKGLGDEAARPSLTRAPTTATATAAAGAPRRGDRRPLLPGRHGPGGPKPRAGRRGRTPRTTARPSARGGGGGTHLPAAAPRPSDGGRGRFGP